MSRSLDIKSSQILVNGNLQVSGNVSVSGSFSVSNLVSNVEYENITFSNVINAKNVYVSSNLTVLPGVVVRFESDLQVVGNVTSQNITSNVNRISNLESNLTLVYSNISILSSRSGFANSITHTTFANTFQTASSVNIDANLYTFYNHFGVLPSGTIAVQVSNLTNGKQINAFFRNIGGTNAPTLTVTTSPGTTGYVAPFMARQSTTVAGAQAGNISAPLVINGGCIFFTVANVSSNVCGYFT